MAANEGRFEDLPAWRAAMELAEEVQRLTAPLRGGGARLAGQLADAAAKVPSRLAQTRSRVGADPQRALEQAEAALLETETFLHLAARLGLLEDVRGALGLVEEVHGLLGGRDSATQRRGDPETATLSGPGAGTQRRVAEPQRGGDAETSRRPDTQTTRSPDHQTTRRPDDLTTRRPDPSPLTTHQPPDRLVIDGCNFLGRAHGYSLGDLSSRDRLLFRLQEYARRHPAHRLSIFFDGQRASRKKTAGVEEQVTSGQRPADDVMIDYLHALPVAERRRCTLVTDDQELTRRARGEGVRVQPVIWLAERLARKGPDAGGVRKSSGLSQNELEDWEEYFSQPRERPGR